MIWKIIVILIIFLIIFPIIIKFKIVFNILRFSGEIHIRILKIINFKIKVKLRGGYVYITQNGRTRREKLTSKNYNIAFVLKFINEIYFRTQLAFLKFNSELGYYNDAMVTALGSSVIDVVSKCIYSRILHNKKSAHIFVLNEAKYNQDCLRAELEGQVSISLFDVIYSFISSVLSLKGDKYERTKAEYEQDKGVD